MNNETNSKFFSYSTSQSPVSQAWTSTAGPFQTPTDIPKMFGGNEQGFSPEDYFSLALQNCFIATFKVVAEKSRLHFESISVNVELQLGKDDSQLMIMKEAKLMIRLDGAENHERALRLLEKTSKNCMILNSVKTKLEFEFQVS